MLHVASAERRVSLRDRRPARPDAAFDRTPDPPLRSGSAPGGSSFPPVRRLLPGRAVASARLVDVPVVQLFPSHVIPSVAEGPALFLSAQRSCGSRSTISLS